MNRYVAKSSENITKITMFKGEELPIEVDFRIKAKQIGSNIVSASHAASNSHITLGTSSISSNVASVVVTAATKGCAVLTSTGTTSEGYDYIGKVEVEVINPTECA